MKLIKLLMLFLVSTFMRSSVSGQANASINVLTLNSGIVNIGGTVDIQVTIGATTGTGGQPGPIPVNKVRAQISIPIAIASALPDAQQTGLPAGWIILSNTGGVITVCNGSDIIPVGEQRQILIKVHGDAIGGPSTVSGQLTFGPGTGVCTGLGSLSGDLTADNVSQSTIQVIPPVNDDAPGAITVTVGGGCSGSPYANDGATQSVSEPFASCKGTAGYKTVWYKFTAPVTGNVKISTDHFGGTMGSDSRLALFSATNVNNYATFTNMACDDDNGTTVAERSILYATGLTSGNTYYIQVDGKDGSTATGTFCLTVHEMTSSMLSTATACAAGQDLTSVNDNYAGWLSAVDGSGNLVAMISNPSGAATTSTYTNSLNINSGPVRTDAVSLQKYLDRNFTISNPGVTSAEMKFFLLNSELTALQTADAGVTLANLQVTRQTGTVCDNDFIAANGTNSQLSQTANYAGTGYSWVQVTSPGLSKFFLHRPAVRMPVKVWLQGAYSTALGRHKNNTTAWVNALNNGIGGNALSQPFSAAPFSYTGTESVTTFITAGNATGTVVTPTERYDWVLLELRSGTTPATVIARRAAFVRCDGLVKDLDNSSDVLFKGVASGTYHMVIRHRNHVAIRTSVATATSSFLGASAPATYEFNTAQSKAFQNTSTPPIPVNTAMRDLTGGAFGMWGGNSNGMTAAAGAANATRASGSGTINDYLYLVNTTLGGNVSLILANRYNPADMNMDGTVRASGGGAINDYLFLINTVLSGNVGLIVLQHQ